MKPYRLVVTDPEGKTLSRAPVYFDGAAVEDPLFYTYVQAWLRQWAPVIPVTQRPKSWLRRWLEW